MHADELSWVFDERRMRVIFAAAATLIALGSMFTGTSPAVGWSTLGTTVVVFWTWVSLEWFPRWPVYIFGLSVPIVLNIVDHGPEVSMFLIVLTIAIIASHESNRLYAGSLLALTLIAVTILSAAGVFGDFGLANWLFGIAFSWGAGETIFRFIGVVKELERTRTLVADQAAVHERRRIARDVHDLVGHSLSVVMLHLTGARHLIRKDPDEAERALEQAELAGRQSLIEIRRTVGMLRDEHDRDSPPVPSANLGDLPGLVDEYVQAGLDVSLDMAGSLTEVDAAIGLAGYRIAQEALANASRHMTGARVEVAVTVSEVECEIAVTNSGGEPVDSTSGSGFGLVSMRERARSVGGSLIAGPTAMGWSVEAILPTSTVEAGL